MTNHMKFQRTHLVKINVPPQKYFKNYLLMNIVYQKMIQQILYFIAICFTDCWQIKVKYLRVFRWCLQWCSCPPSCPRCSETSFRKYIKRWQRTLVFHLRSLNWFQCIKRWHEMLVFHCQWPYRDYTLTNQSRVSAGASLTLAVILMSSVLSSVLWGVKVPRPSFPPCDPPPTEEQGYILWALRNGQKKPIL